MVVKRCVSIVLTLTLALGFMPFSANAVTPSEALFASALVSFMASAGARLYRDGGVDGADQMVEDVKTLWSDFVSGFDGDAPTWESVVGNGGVATSSGKFFIEHDQAQTMQSFLDWLNEQNNFKPDLTYNFSGDNSYNYGYQGKNVYCNRLRLTVPINYTYNGTIQAYCDPQVIYQTDVRDYFLALSFDAGNLASEFYWCHCIDNQGNDSIYIYVPEGLTSSSNDFTLILYGEEEPYSLSSRYFILGGSSGWKRLSYLTKGSYLIGLSSLEDLTSVDGPPQLLSGGSRLLLDVGKSISNVVYDLTDGQSLVVDVGASADTAEDDLIDFVVDNYSVPDSDVLPISVSYPATIEGATELYPQPITTDIDGLGVPTLGQALTSRFPFCIPFDVVECYKSLSATPVRPVITIDVIPSDLKSKIGITSNTSFVLDFGDDRFSTLLILVRWSCIVGFLLGLAYMTKRLIWTSGG